ncbi:MAG TPA: hypothetical protein VD905_01200 [Flavobacteriales bacterium]|nr:hypothetical protein [Flavobacteriales bacterium]
MQKKILTGVMLLAVVLIWGYVGYRFIGGMGSDEEELLAEDTPVEETSVIRINAKQKLLLNYTDPFLKQDIKPAPIKTGGKPLPQPIKKIEKPVVPVNNFNWPTVLYKGLIQNQSHPDKLLALVIVNGKEHIVRKGERVEDLLVTNIDKNKVELVHDQEKKVFGK